MLSRRQALLSSATLPLAATLPASIASAEAPMLGSSRANIRRIVLGDYEVTTMLVGQMPRENPNEFFGLNVGADEFEAVSRENFLNPAQAQFFFTPTIVNTGSELVLFDTGLSAPAITAALASAGYTPEQVDTVVISHMHGDHIGGLMTDGDATFANARHLIGATEFDYWEGAENEQFEQLVRPLTDRFEFIDDGASIGSGLTGINAFGHTPGHMVYRIESAGQNLILFADLTNHPVWSLANPDWHFTFDIDPDAASASRRAVLTMIAEERIPAIGYHMPFPAIGYVDTQGDGFRWVPEGGQFG